MCVDLFSINVHVFVILCKVCEHVFNRSALRRQDGLAQCHLGLFLSWQFLLLFPLFSAGSNTGYRGRSKIGIRYFHSRARHTSFGGDPLRTRGLARLVIAKLRNLLIFHWFRRVKRVARFPNRETVLKLSRFFFLQSSEEQCWGETWVFFSWAWHVVLQCRPWAELCSIWWKRDCRECSAEPRRVLENGPMHFLTSQTDCRICLSEKAAEWVAWKCPVMHRGDVLAELYSCTPWHVLSFVFHEKQIRLDLSGWCAFIRARCACALVKSSSRLSRQDTDRLSCQGHFLERTDFPFWKMTEIRDMQYPLFGCGHRGWQGVPP